MDIEARIRSIPVFDGYPYLVTAVAGAMHHLIVLPGDISPRELERLARRQYHANRLRTCLVLAPDFGEYATERGELAPGPSPWCEVPVCDRLLASKAFPAAPELLARQERLRAFVEAQRREGYLVDQARGRAPRPDELWWLAGRNAAGVPNGLVRCVVCAGWRGEALVGDRVAEVLCRCENHNRCARCLELLYERRLDACGYFEDERKVLHVPGFSGLGHRCP